MSLITLTFGNGHPYDKGGKLAHTRIKRPNDSKLRGNGKGKVQVLKADEFFGTEGTFLLSRLVEGCVHAGMESENKGAHIEITEIESKYGNDFLARPGASVGLMVSGATKYDFQEGQVIEWTAKPVVEEPKKKGRVIIC